MRLSACFPLSRRGAPVAPFCAIPPALKLRLARQLCRPDSTFQLLVLSSAPCFAFSAGLDTTLTRFKLDCSMRVQSPRGKPPSGTLPRAQQRGKLRRSLPVDDELRQLLMRLRNLLTRRGTREKKLLAALAPCPRNLLRSELISFGLNRLQARSAPAGPTYMHGAPPYRPSNNGPAAQRPWCSRIWVRGGKQERQIYATQPRRVGGHLGAGQSVSAGLSTSGNESRKGLFETLRLSEASIRRPGLEERASLQLPERS